MSIASFTKKEGTRKGIFIQIWKDLSNTCKNVLGVELIEWPFQMFVYIHIDIN